MPVTVLSPEAEGWRPAGFIPQRVSALSRSRVAIVNNGWTSMDLLADRFREALLKNYGATDIKEWRVPYGEPPPPGVLDQITQGSDVAIVGLAN